jgi:hypothetical protein
MGTFSRDLNWVVNAMVDSVWRGSRPFVRWAAICTQMAFCGTQVWQVLHVWAYLRKIEQSFEFLLCSCLVWLLSTMPRYPRSDPTPIGPIRLALTHTLQHTLLATQTSTVATTTCLDSGNHDMSRLSKLAYLNGAPIHGLTDIPLRLLPTDIGCGTLGHRALADALQHTPLATQTSTVATTTCLYYLHPHT